MDVGEEFGSDVGVELGSDVEEVGWVCDVEEVGWVCDVEEVGWVCDVEVEFVSITRAVTDTVRRISDEA